MVDTAAVAFDPKPRQLGPTMNLIAGEAILAGSVVSFASTGVDDTVWNALSTIGNPVGVALHSAASGAKVTVATAGTICLVLNGTDAAILAGKGLMTYSVKGTVIAQSVAAADAQVIGYAVGTIAASTTGYAMITGPLYVGKTA